MTLITKLFHPGHPFLDRLLDFFGGSSGLDTAIKINELAHFAPSLIINSNLRAVDSVQRTYPRRNSAKLIASKVLALLFAGKHRLHPFLPFRRLVSRS
jgi:hypothetical protein